VREAATALTAARTALGIAHVVGVYEETETGEVFFRVQDGTHTTQHWCHQGDLLTLYEPAGWSVPTRVKPTYALTRGHGVEDHHDLMTDGGQSTEELDQATRVCDGGGRTVEVDVDDLQEVNQLLFKAMEKANISADKPIRPSRAIALKRSEKAHKKLSEIIPGWHDAE